MKKHFNAPASAQLQQAMTHFLRCGYAYGWQHEVTQRYYSVYRQRWMVEYA